jgi:hypothetical protein
LRLYCWLFNLKNIPLGPFNQKSNDHLIGKTTPVDRRMAVFAKGRLCRPVDRRMAIFAKGRLSASGRSAVPIFWRDSLKGVGQDAFS